MDEIGLAEELGLIAVGRSIEDFVHKLQALREAHGEHDGCDSGRAVAALLELIEQLTDSDVGRITAIERAIFWPTDVEEVST